MPQKNLENMQRVPLLFLKQMVFESVIGKFLMMAVCVAVASILETSTPLALRHVIDGLSQPAGSPRTETIYSFVVLLLLGAGAMTAYRLYQWINTHMGPNLRAHVQARQIEYLLQRSPASTGGRQSDGLVEAIKRSSMNCVNLCELLTFDVVNVVVAVVNTAIVLAIADPWYALSIALWLVVYVTGTVLFATRCLRFGSAQFMASGRSAGEIGDVLRNMETVFNYGSRPREQAFLQAGLLTERERTQRLQRYVLAMRIFGSVAVYGFFALMTALAFRDVMAGERSVGGFALVFTATNILTMTIFDLSRQLITVFENLGSLDGALEMILEAKMVAPSAPAPTRAQVVSSSVAPQVPAIEFRRVHFSYPGQPPLFEGLDLRLPRGSRLGLVGPSGAGKTTLVRLLLGQLAATSGEILIDGTRIEDIDEANRSTLFAVVSQHSGLFNRSLRENIAYGLPDASDEQIMRIASLAAADSFIERRPRRLDSVVGESGSELSGGERQRLSLARALLKPGDPLLILDEATSALDSATEQQIQFALRKAMTGRTVVAIAHRISTIMEMDRILYLDGGRIFESGTHTELLAQQGRYAGIWQRQAQYSMRIEA